MLEFGEKSEELHQKVGKFCTLNKKVKNLLTVGEKSKNIKKSAIKSGLDQKKTEHFSTVKELIEANLPLSFFGEVIYIKGSLGIKLLEFFKYITQK